MFLINIMIPKKLKDIFLMQILKEVVELEVNQSMEEHLKMKTFQ